MNPFSNFYPYNVVIVFFFFFEGDFTEYDIERCLLYPFRYIPAALATHFNDQVSTVATIMENELLKSAVNDLFLHFFFLSCTTESVPGEPPKTTIGGVHFVAIAVNATDTSVRVHSRFGRLNTEKRAQQRIFFHHF